MLGTARQIHFTHALEHFSTKLGELLSILRCHSSNLTPELLDEIAYMTGELTIVLANHNGHQEEESIKEVLLLAKSLRQRLRSDQLKGEQIVQAFNPLREKIDQLLVGQKKGGLSCTL
jgi:hypothetical protein